MLGSIIRLRRAKNRPTLFSESHSRPGEAGSLEVPLRGSEEGNGIMAGPWVWDLRWGGGSRGGGTSQLPSKAVPQDQLPGLLLYIFEESSRREGVGRENEDTHFK